MASSSGHFGASWASLSRACGPPRRASSRWWPPRSSPAACVISGWFTTGRSLKGWRLVDDSSCFYVYFAVIDFSCYSVFRVPFFMHFLLSFFFLLSLFLPSLIISLYLFLSYFVLLFLALFIYHTFLLILFFSSIYLHIYLAIFFPITPLFCPTSHTFLGPLLCTTVRHCSTIRFLSIWSFLFIHIFFLLQFHHLQRPQQLPKTPGGVAARHASGKFE